MIIGKDVSGDSSIRASTGPEWEASGRGLAGRGRHLAGTGSRKNWDAADILSATRAASCAFRSTASTPGRRARVGHGGGGGGGALA